MLILFYIKSYNNWEACNMFSPWIRRLLKPTSALLTAALILIAPIGSAQDQPVNGREVHVDDVLDHPEEYVGQTVTLEGEVDHIYGNTVFAMEDDQDFV